ncbi:MAG: hypothetical protein K9W42_14100 [Candidatus Heimdallarchaeota archaeon]|nr:hypothetical protein [Candidatus Heimdallarchaeota archaeon]
MKFRTMHVSFLIIFLFLFSSLSVSEATIRNSQYQPSTLSTVPIITLQPTSNALEKAQQPVVRILVHPDLWQNTTIQNAVVEYQQDLNDQGFNALLYTSAVGSAETLRALFQSWYSSENLEGVVLIGQYPQAYFHHDEVPNYYPAETFICDLFLTDLDGVWEDLDPVDGIYDSHTGEIHPEIYLGRIDPSSRTFGSLSVEEEIYRYLKKCHAYRQRELSRPHKALTFIDDDWEAWANGTYDNWPGWLSSTYPMRTDIFKRADTCKDVWLEYMTKNYEWFHLCAHSSATTHYLKVDGMWQTITNTEINNLAPPFLFYNLYCCHAADWDTNDSLAVTYLYSSSSSLAVVGSTKSGGMLGGNHFYSQLAQNKTIGFALYSWFQNFDYYTTYYIEFFYGMTILGDPFLTNDIDCTVLKPQLSSPTHPDPSKKYLKTKPEFTWTEPTDAHRIVGYYYLLDQDPTTKVTKDTGIFVNDTSLKITQRLENGTWYFHLVAEDSLGNIGKNTAHFKVNVNRVALRKIIISSSVGGAVVFIALAVGGKMKK